MMTKPLSMIVIATLLVTGADRAAGLTAAAQCAAAKLKAAAKYSACRLKAERKAIVSGRVVDYVSCDRRFATGWDAAETRAAGACPSVGDQSAVQAAISGLTDNLATAIDGGALEDCPAELMSCATDLAACQADLVAALACGNAFVDAGEQCDQANLHGETCVSRGFVDGTLACGSGCVFDTSACVPAPTRIIFASSLLMEPGYPSYVYPEGADARCQALANASPLTGRPFKALICGASPDVAGGVALGVRDRFTAAPGGWMDTQGNRIADDLDDLLDGTIMAPIIYDEFGSQIVIGGDREYAWTGCAANGAPNPPEYRCQHGIYSWTTGHVGTTGGKGHLLSTTGGTFLDAEIEACSAPLHLICVEQ